jgi:3-oxoacyl-[acyl-carrier protein] reductase
MTQDFATKTTLVTGGAQGIGLEIVRQFLKAGAEVHVWDYSSAALESAKNELGDLSEKAHFTAVDITNRGAIAEAALKISPNLHILINNAGITRDKSFAKMALEDWDAVVQTNLTGVFNVTKGLMDKFTQQPEGKRIINIASVVALYGNFGQANYAATKAGVVGFTKTLAKELGRKGFTVNAVAPGFIETAMTKAMPPEALESMRSKVPVGRLGKVEDIARACLYLASSEASYINGSVLSVDGGLTL